MSSTLANMSIPPSPSTSQSKHRFSAFPLTGHLHTPQYRLISRHPNLVLRLTFLRVPEITDGFSWTTYLARSTTVEDVVDNVCNELGLAKMVSGHGGGPIEYVIEEVLGKGKSEGISLSVKSNYIIVNIFQSDQSVVQFQYRR